MSILQVALPRPVRRLFDYRPPPGAAPATPEGCRVQVPFGRGRSVGVVVARASASELPDERLRSAEVWLDDEPLLDAGLLKLLSWAWRYYHHPPGEVVATALPVPLRQGKPAQAPSSHHWRLTPDGAAVDASAVSAAPRQAALLAALAEGPRPRSELAPLLPGGDGPLRALAAKGWVERIADDAPESAGAIEPAPALNAEQTQALAAVESPEQGFAAYLLDGVTGSGKTEVYLHLIDGLAAHGRQALVVVPEIGLTPQLLDRFRRRLSTPVVALHSGLSQGERLSAWLAARAGRAGVVVGTRSAVLAPLPNLGLIVVDEEHDASLKQHEGFRYNARDVAVVRAQRAGVAVLLGSATPSLESLHNVAQGRYRHLRLTERAGGARPAELRLLDCRRRPQVAGLADRLRELMREHLDRGEQVLVFRNRRGYAPVLLCHDCGWHAQCRRCDANMTLHRSEGLLRCHHCALSGAPPARCPACEGAELRELGQGTERIEAVLAELFPDVPVHRIDRDTTRRKGSLDALLAKVRNGGACILVGTQMLAKGHDLPGVTLVGIVDVDYGLMSADFRAAERVAQLVVQVVGRAGRAERPGVALLQTHQPAHPLLERLTHEGYPAFAEAALAERRETGFPPFSHAVLVRAEAHDRADAERFLHQARERALPPPSVELLGPVPAPMERRAGRYRYQLLALGAHRGELQRWLDIWVPNLEKLKQARRARWSLDVDPVDTA